MIMNIQAGIADKTNWHELKVAELFKILKSSPAGLSLVEAQKRLEIDGPNELPEAPSPSWLKILARQFSGVLINILVVASIVTFFLGEHVDAAVILVAVTINVLVGFFQERKAERALYELKKVVSFIAEAHRDKHHIKIPARELVLGDIIDLQAGDRVPADARLTRVTSFEVNEALLTGESMPIVKSVHELPAGTAVADRRNMVFMGTTVTAGSAEAVVVEVGEKTQIGQVAWLLNETKRDPTPLEKRLTKLGHAISIIVLIIGVSVLSLGIALGFSWGQMLAMAVAIAVSAIPEGMVVAVTAILALGMRRILKRQALVRELLAAETLGSTTVICTDKTGTLTTGEMQVAVISTPAEERLTLKEKLHDGASSFALLRLGVLSSNAFIENPQDELSDWRVIGSPTERALVMAGLQAGMPVADIQKQFKKIDEIPFDSQRKYMAVLQQDAGDGRWLYVKGAPEVVLGFSSKYQMNRGARKLTEIERRKVNTEIKEFSQEGLRLLALAVAQVDKKVSKISELFSKADDYSLTGLTFQGLVGIKDPLRPEVARTMAVARQAGIKVVMITGDHKLTAQTIAKELQLPAGEENIMEGKDLTKLDDEALRKKISAVSVFARTTPHDKPRIIDAWQARGEVVAMTGDGVNDAAALKSADIGVALGSGSDVARETADIVLLDNNFKTIVAAVEEGRVIYQNIRKMVLYLLSDSFSEVVLILGAFILGAILGGDWPLPILATQILWINLVTDSFPALAFTVEPPSGEVMQEKPIDPAIAILDTKRRALIVTMSLVRGALALAVFWWLYKINAGHDYLRTIIFTTMVISSLLYAISCKQLKLSFLNRKSWNNKYLTIALLLGLVMQLAVIYLPWLQDVFNTVALTTHDWLLVVGLSALVLVVVELAKRRLFQSAI
ncbi:TPA: hypothetical protein DIC39_00820 [Patescibacteria group bacterium]|nr:hypothetical protein [Patescibacteria group bacterium]HCU47593.1 hypothetical protein [Patescibacteria group bacterium]